MTTALVWLALLQVGFDSPQEAFQRAETLYQEQHYDEAIAAYEAMRAQDVEDGVLYYNLGNAYFKAGHLGRAILSYERALALMPGDEDARANLEFANELIADAVQPAPLPLVVSFFVDLYRRLQPNAFARLLSLSFLIGGVATSLCITDLGERVRRVALVVVFGSTLLALVSGVALASKVSAAATDVQAIVVSENAYVRSGPGTGNPQLAEIHEGLKVKVIGAREDWLQVTLPNGLSGWLRESEVERI